MRHRLVLPDYLVEQTRDYAGELEALAVLTDEVKHWTRELKQVDENLELVWVPEGVEHPALVAGRFHIIEHRPLPTPPNVTPLVGDEDSYVEPGAWMFEMLRRNDNRSERSVRAREERQAKLETARQRAKERESEERAAQLDDHLKTILHPGISMHQSAGRQWTNRAHAKRSR
jgi:hypothetical protein